MDLLPEEKAVALFVNGEKIVTLMATPDKLRALAIGFIHNTGILKELSQLERLYACDDNAEIRMEGEKLEYQALGISPLITSGCGAATSIAPEDRPPIQTDTRFSLDKIRRGFARMMRENTRYQKSGGMHTAALLSGAYFALAEDVGRHNAHDKVTGMALEADVPLKNAAIISTGRISSDMVVKAVYARVPVLASLSVPTDMALRLAHTHGITLIGRAMKENPVVYSHNTRITDFDKNPL